MPNTNSIPKNYDAGDLADIYMCSESDMQWMNTAISFVRKEIKKLKELAVNGEEITQHNFTDLIHHIDMYEYLAEERLSHHVEKAEHYSKEWEQLKGGRNA
ncbi:MULTISPECIES: hypothetical protein [unclassified Acinetobacter]|uniref:hypothetical protein n=1 Tax=unclassified Acinetobacter TaxID=196816 RepID=UPI0029341B7B|nr:MULTISPECIES: hypothetical protein [unclassified Acinetobacter]WOE32962.1 hypothetical protein QSG84_07390 [Acinetobacter sp. SAAs470]WOE38439.1 hypothetical protein QSG86_16445 [Acinetobacter sp. SAAs474]